MDLVKHGRYMYCSLKVKPASKTWSVWWCRAGLGPDNVIIFQSGGGVGPDSIPSSALLLTAGSVVESFQ